MSRVVAAALAAFLLVGPASAAQDEKKPETEVDAKTRAAIERAIERAKEDIRNEVRAEIQGAQSAAEFLGTVAEGPKLEFLQLDGYYRTRGQLYNKLSLKAGTDASGRFLFPVPLNQPPGSEGSTTLATANMRLRLEPTLNVSEHVRVRAQVDVLDNHVLGSSTSTLYDAPGSPYPVPFYGASRVVRSQLDGRVVLEETPYVSPKRAWAEIQSPVGLLSFGRMPSEWGLGVLTNAGAGIDDDFGDTVDRIQFALPPVSTPIGRLTFVPILDFDNEGPLYADPRAARGTGQPLDADSGDDGRTYALKIARFDTEDEVRRKTERNEASVNYGAYYNYRTQRAFFPDQGVSFDPALVPTTQVQSVHRSAYAHIVDVWFRFLSARWRFEVEATGVYGSIGNPSDDATPDPKLLLRQWGGAAVLDYKLKPNKLTIGGEVGAASGDDAPGFGNVPGIGVTPFGSLEGQQWGLAGDHTIRNFRFNQAYRVDLILFRQILGQVTDALYVKPKLRWDILPGLGLDVQLVYSRALESSSTPSATGPGTGSSNLGLELDTMVTYTAGDGFQAWLQYGFLQPLGGLEPAGRSVSRAQALAVGLAAKF
jgi:uncharacterized protein (TIGR04551 family)